jgi:hypothetical protein
LIGKLEIEIEDDVSLGSVGRFHKIFLMESDCDITFLRFVGLPGMQ